MKPYTQYQKGTYLNLLNLSNSTITVHDHVFRKLNLVTVACREDTFILYYESLKLVITPF